MEGGEEEDVGLAVMARFRNSAAPEHQHLRAVVGAVAEVLKEQGLPSSPTAYFAATMSSLERQCGSVENFKTDPVTTAFCTFLAMLLPRLSISVVRSKGAAALTLLFKLLKEDGVLAGTVKSGLTCMEHLMRCADTSNWLILAPSFELLLKYCLDQRPKVRRRAQVCIAAVLSSLKGFPALEMASDSVFLLLDQSVMKVSGNLSAGKGSKSIAISATSDAVEVLHVLGSLQHLLPVMSAKGVGKTLPHFGKLLDIRHNLVTKHVLNALQALSTNSDTRIPVAVFGDLLEKVAGLLSPAKKDVDEVLTTLRALEKGLQMLHHVDPAVCASKLPAIFHAVSGLLASGQDGIVFGAAECLRSLVTNCIDDGMISQGLSQLEAQGTICNTGPPMAIVRICATLESTLGYQYAAAWDMALHVITALFDRLDSSSSPLLGSIVNTLADLQNLSDEYMVCRKQLHSTLGAAVAAMGPDKFLELLPLEMDSEDVSKYRVWLLPILRQSVVGARLQYFVDNLLPLSVRLRKRAEQCASEGKPVASKNAEACVQSIWALLPSFCNYPCDIAKSFRLIAKPLGDALDKEVELRGLICSSLQILIRQNRLARGDRIELENADDNGLEHSASVSGAAEKARKLYTAEAASVNLSAIAVFSRNFLPLLFNLFNTASREKRGDLQATIEAFASISDKATVKNFFVAIMQKLLKATKGATEASEGFASHMQVEGASVLEEPTLQRCVFMDLALSLIQGLDDEALGMLYSAAKPGLQDTNGTVQKKAYKVLASICKEHEKFLQRRSDEILETLLTVLASCQTSAKRYRLLTLRYIMIHLLKINNQRRDEAIATLLSEVILALKESNKKTRNTSYDLLVGIGREMLQLDNTGSQENLLRFFRMVVGCLAGTTPHMISAAVTGLARLIYEFSSELCHMIPELLPSAFLLLRSRSREIIKSVLGLVKVVIVRQPAEDLEKHLQSIIEGLMLWSDDSKNHFKAKVRTIMEKLIRKFGYDIVFSVTPKEHVKLLVNIRKTKEQAERKRQVLSGGNADETKSFRSIATTARSKWDHTNIFSDNSDEEDSDLEDGSTRATSFSKASSFAKSRSVKSKKLQNSRRLPEETLDVGSTDEPLDLLNTQKIRGALSILKSKTEQARDVEELAFAPDGRLIVDESNEHRTPTGKRERFVDDDDAEDGSQGQKKRSRSRLGLVDKPKEKGNLKLKSATLKRRKPTSGWAYKGEEYANKRGTGGDVKKEGKMDPYAYWPLDPKMLNRREGKKAAARKGMSSVLKMTKKLQGSSVKKALAPKGFSVKRKQKSHKGKS
ncbi:hypothetical protein O6H91_13G046200 [Diphasiastrum complanatum]|uniref:Uncharacterized protein n=4 Tax=Diphasiastrum complanatum TaxID=34168 RepID=A0ACC2BUL8_DIPCM|nr:hypothetical protein O6H91_13G046200 [Diphasiastrum complanatum]KAJ7533388.1 hypothetical protein O6H91_13G046200 [Diphasiastrum complanatum]KAJ7533389.1 hypothetical protein O6H91_13G046200 [Diphasiastrum complanatum]KAJ7533390.1 hypothetical protein O6H91_13G046200 [Diphasiastrum complanatum]